MGDPTPALVAIASIVGGLVALAKNLPRIRQLFRVDQAAALAVIRERAELFEAKYEIVTDELAEERAAHAQTIEELRLERDAGARCRRELDDARSELRAMQRRRRGAQPS